MHMRPRNLYAALSHLPPATVAVSNSCMRLVKFDLFRNCSLLDHALHEEILLIRSLRYHGIKKVESCPNQLDQ